jgi:FkbM family methyltransferase
MKIEEESKPAILDRFCRAVGHSNFPGSRRLIGWVSARRKHFSFQCDISGVVYKGNTEDYIDRQIYYFGRYAPAELDFLADAAAWIGQESYWEFLDIGANVGQHALWMSRHAKVVHAFEPSVRLVGRILENVSLNKLTNVRVHPVALGVEDDQIPLGSGFPGNSGSRSLCWTLQASLNELVSVRNGDAYLSTALKDGVRIGLIKIDVEGFEKHVLLGLKNLICRDRPIILLEMIGTERKGGFSSAAELSAVIYADHVLFGLSGASTYSLGPYDWATCEEVVCVPIELLRGKKFLGASIPVR